MSYCFIFLFRMYSLFYYYNCYFWSVYQGLWKLSGLPNVKHLYPINDSFISNHKLRVTVNQVCSNNTKACLYLQIPQIKGSIPANYSLFMLLLSNS